MSTIVMYFFQSVLIVTKILMSEIIMLLFEIIVLVTSKIHMVHVGNQNT